MSKDFEKFIEGHPSSRAVLGIDDNLMFIVDSAKEWHEKNVLLNKDEYYRNDIIGRLKNRRSKSDDKISYGVINYDHLSKIMIHWDNLSVSSQFLKGADFLQIPDSGYGTGAYVIDTFLKHNRENAILVNLLANDLTEIEELLCKIFSNNGESIEDIRKYVRENYYELINLFSLDCDQDFYIVDGYRIKLLYDVVEKYNRLLLPNTLLQYLEMKKVNIANRRKVLLATKEYLRVKGQRDKNILNSSYTDDYIRNASYTLK